MRLLLLAAVFWLANAHAGGVYTWTDSAGVVHYTDRPVGPDGSAQVAGMDLGQKPVSQGGGKASAESLQGVWCAFEIVTGNGSSAIATRVEWHFTGVQLLHHDLNSGSKITSKFEVKDNSVLSDRPSIGQHKVQLFAGDELQLGEPDRYYRLHRGNCS